MPTRSPRSPLVALPLVAALALAALAARADAGRPSAPAAALPRPDIREWTLDNGLDVVFLSVHKAPLVTVQVWVHAGSKDEARDRRGSAHMFEHMMFKGTRHVPPEEHARLIDRIGGEENAFTTEDMTAYHDTVPRQYLDFAVRLEAERMRNLLFRKDMVDTEREVVKEEIRQRENHPIQAALVRFRDLAFTRHPYAWDAGGRIEDLDATTPEDLERFYDTYYQPNNATLVVVGDVTEEEVRASAQRWFGGIPRAAAPPRPADGAPEPPQTGLRREVARPAQIGVIIGGYKIPEGKHADVYALGVLASILSDGESSRLNQRIVRKDRVGVGAGAFLQPLEHPGLLLVFAVHLTPDQGPRAEAALLDEIARLHRERVSERELAKARNQLAAKLVFSLEDVSGVATQIGASKIIQGDPRAWLDAYGRYLAVTADDVQRVARTYLAPDRLTLMIVPPEARAGEVEGAEGGAR